MKLPCPRRGPDGMMARCPESLELDFFLVLLLMVQKSGDHQLIWYNVPFMKNK